MHITVKHGCEKGEKKVFQALLSLSISTSHLTVQLYEGIVDNAVVCSLLRAGRVQWKCGGVSVLKYSIKSGLKCVPRPGRQSELSKR